MKHVLALIIGLSGFITTHANCITRSLWAFPYTQTIKQNSIFVINGLGGSETIILNLNKEYNVYLKNGQTKVRLLVKETHGGQAGMTQAILRPEGSLEPGREYTLCIDSLPEDEHVGRYNEVTHTYEPLTYKVLAEKDTAAPKVLLRPKEIGKTLIHYGCGWDNYVLFNHPAKDDTDVVLIKTTVVALKTGRARTYYLPPYGPNSDLILIGYEMCGGQFSFEEGDDYEVEFSFMDACGNATVWTGDRIKFTKPDKEGRLEYR